MNLLRRFSLVAMLIGLVAMMMPEDLSAQRRGGSFGGRRSFSSPSRSYRAPSNTNRSFGGRRSTQPSNYGSRSRSTDRSSMPSMGRNSFGGSRMTSSKDYTSRYGVPRQTSTQRMAGANGGQTYVINRYGGMGDGFMMGYLMGSIPWYFSMPFHPAFYFSRPYTAANPDGSMSVYPGTFQWGTLLFTLLIVAGVLFILYVWYKQRRRRMVGADDMSDSSFA